MSTPGVERGREYTVQEIAEERRYQEQCFLLYWLQYLATENKHIDYSSAFYPIEGDPETMISVLTGKKGLGLIEKDLYLKKHDFHMKDITS